MAQNRGEGENNSSRVQCPITDDCTRSLQYEKNNGADVVIPITEKCDATLLILASDSIQATLLR